MPSRSARYRRQEAGPASRERIPRELPPPPPVEMRLPAWLMAKAAKAATGAAAKVFADGTRYRDNPPSREASRSPHALPPSPQAGESPATTELVRSEGDAGSAARRNEELGTSDAFDELGADPAGGDHRSGRQRSQDEAEPSQRPQKLPRTSEVFPVGSAVIRKRDDSRGRVRSLSNRGGWIRVHLDGEAEDQTVACRRKELKRVDDRVADAEQSPRSPRSGDQVPIQQQDTADSPLAGDEAKTPPAPIQSLLRDTPVEDVFGDALLPPDFVNDPDFLLTPAGRDFPQLEITPGDASPPELRELRDFQGTFSSTMPPSPQDGNPSEAEPARPSLQVLAETEGAVVDSVRVERAAVDRRIATANSEATAAERNMEHAIAAARAEAIAVQQDWDQRAAAAEKRAVDAQAQQRKVGEEARIAEQHAAEVVEKRQIVPCGTAELEGARHAANELVRVAKAAKLQHLSACEVNLKLAKELSSKALQEARAKLQTAVDQTRLAQNRAAEAKDAAQVLNNAKAAARQRDAAQALDRALAHEGKAKEYVEAVEHEVAVLQESAEAATNKEKLAFEQRVLEAERLASELLMGTGLKELAERMRPDVEKLVSGMQQRVAEVEAATSVAVEQQLKDRMSRAAEMRRIAEVELDESKHVAGERVATFERKVSASVQERRVGHEEIVKAAEERSISARNDAAKLLEAAEAEAHAAEEKAKAVQAGVLRDIEDAEAHADRQAKLLLEQLAAMEREIPDRLDAAQSDYQRRARGAEEDLAKAKQALIDHPKHVLSQWTERVKDSQNNLGAARQAASAASAAEKLAAEQAAAAEWAADHSVHQADLDMENHRQTCNTQIEQAEQQATDATRTAKKELAQAKEQLERIEKMAAETLELAKLVHEDEMEAVSKDAAATMDVITREQQVLQSKLQLAEVNAASAELKARQIIQEAQHEAVQKVTSAKSHHAAVKQNAEDTWKRERAEADFEVSVAQDAANAAKSTAADQIEETETETHQSVQEAQLQAEDAERTAETAQHELAETIKKTSAALEKADIQKANARSQTADIIAAQRQRLRSAESSAAERLDEAERLKGEAQKMSDLVCQDFAAKMKAANLVQDQFSGELDQKAEKAEQDAVEELAKVSASLKKVQDEAKGIKDKAAAEIQAAEASLSEQKRDAAERLAASESWARDSIQMAEADLEEKRNAARLLRAKATGARQRAADSKRSTREAQQSVVENKEMEIEARSKMEQATQKCKQMICNIQTLMANEVAQGRAEKDKRVSDIEKEVLRVEEVAGTAEDKAQVAEEALAEAEQAAEDLVDRAQQERDDEVHTLEKKAQQAEKKAAKLMDCAHKVKDCVHNAEGVLIGYFKDALEARDVPSPCTPPVPEQDGAGETIEGGPPGAQASNLGSPMPTTPVRKGSRPMRSSLTLLTTKSGVISRVSSSVDAPGWGMLRTSVRSALYENSMPSARRSSLGIAGEIPPRHSVDGIARRQAK